MSIIGKSNFVSPAQIKEAESGAVRTLGDVIDALAQQNPALHAKLEELRDNLSALGADLDAVIRVSQPPDPTAKLPAIKAALVDALRSTAHYDKELESVEVNDGRVLIMYDINWGDPQRITSFVDTVNATMKQQFKNVAFDVTSNGME